MSLTVATEIPASIERGSAYSFKLAFTDYPTSAWTAALVLGRNGSAPLSFAATISAGMFLWTLTNANTLTITPGWWDFAIHVSDATYRVAAQSGRIPVLNNLAVAQTASVAQTMLTALEAAITTLSANVNSSVSFNGQSFTKADIASLMAKRVQLQAEVIREQQTLDALRGTANSSFISVGFGEMT